MGAIALTYQSGDLFIPNVNFTVPFECAAISGFTGPGIATIVTSVSAQTNELQQFFVGFDDLITFVERVRPKRILTVHGFAREFAQTLRERGWDALAIGQGNQLEFKLSG